MLRFLKAMQFYLCEMILFFFYFPFISDLALGILKDLGSN